MTIQNTDFNLPGQTNTYSGKVRDVYTINDTILVSVATDRLSAFDVILPRAIPHKGQVLNQLASYFLHASSDIIPNWLTAIPDPNVSIGHKCQPYDIEMVVRGYLVGHAWREYKAGKRELCGIALPEGMQEYDAFPEPIVTPSTKVREGHDEDISAAEIISQGLATEAEFAALSKASLALFAKGQSMATEQKLILVDTKYEFGTFEDALYVIDEIHTPDSSRYFYADSYDTYIRDRTGAVPKHLSKEFVRQWLLEHNFSGQAGQQIPEMDDAFVAMVSQRYIELYEQLTGQKFEPATDENPVARIEKNILKALGNS